MPNEGQDPAAMMSMLTQAMGGGMGPSPEEALSVLEQATNEIRTTRDQHDLVRQCLGVLKMTVQQWRAMQDPPPGNEPPGKLLTEGGG